MLDADRIARTSSLPLSALRSFEATARRGSMSGAAVELNVTPGAVSRQITALERLVGTALFERGARGVSLTEAGRQLFLDVEGGFEKLRAGLRQAGRQSTPVRLTALPSFATRWLLPRLVLFQKEYPEIDVRVHSSLDIMDLTGGHHDLAVRYGRGSWPGVSADLLMGGIAYPVCSPDFLTRVPRLATPADLLGVPLVHNSATERWEDWFAENGVAVGPIRRGIVVDDYALALEYALGGHGVALGRDALVRADIATGRLVRPVAGGLLSRFGYYLARSTAHSLTEDAEVFAAWLRREARNS
jgi:LysR family glycine cleavage system transcriptional activator